MKKEAGGDEITGEIIKRNEGWVNGIHRIFRGMGEGEKGIGNG